MDTAPVQTSARTAALPLAHLRPSQTKIQQQRRAHFDKNKLQELADSIKAQGQLQPILVRPLLPEPGHQLVQPLYEIIAGERRYLASKLAGLTTVDCVIRGLDDAQVLEAQLVENLQREDVNPLEEAEGYRELIDLKKIKAEDLGALVGKSRAYIYGRMKLLDLCPAARKTLEEGKIDASVALLIARIPDAEMQELAAIGCANGQDENANRYGSSDEARPLTHEEAEEYIKEEFMRRIEGNAAIAAAKQAGKPVIDGDKARKIWKHRHSDPSGHILLDTDYWVDGKTRNLLKDLGPEPAGAVLIQSPHTGEAKLALTKEKARAALLEKKLKLPYHLQPTEPTKTVNASAGSAASKEDRAAAEAKRAREERELRLKLEITTAIAKATRAKYPAKLGKPELLDLIDCLDAMDRPDEDVAPVPAKLDKLTEKQLNAVVLDYVLMSNLKWDTRAMLAAAKRYGVKVDKIKADMTAAFNAREKELAATAKPAAATKAKKK